MLFPPWIRIPVARCIRPLHDFISCKIDKLVFSNWKLVWSNTKMTTHLSKTNDILCFVADDKMIENRHATFFFVVIQPVIRRHGDCMNNSLTDICINTFNCNRNFWFFQPFLVVFCCSGVLENMNKMIRT